MKEQIDILVKLQEIETESGKIKVALHDLPAKLDEIDIRLKTEEQYITDETARIAEMRKNYRNYEADVQSNLSKIEKQEEKLRTVKTNKEYHSLLKEIEELKEKNSKIEDEMLAYLEQIESLESDIADKKGKLDHAKKASEQEKKRITQYMEKGKKKIANLDTEWNSISKNIEPGLLDRFMTVKSRVGYPALAPVRNFVCQGCNLNIPPQMYNELQRCDSLKFCPHCQRMIYYEINNGKDEN
jgi:predicted  nucleic acid-binding Zn-ribbon protein